MVNPAFPEMQPTLGQSVDELPTPTVVADLDVLERNLAHMRDLADEYDVAVRSHVKSHKMPAIARRQQAVFDGGFLCQKLGEAEVMARYGIEDLLLVCPVVSEAKLDRLCWVIDQVERFAVMADGRDNVAPLQAAAERHDVTINVVVEVDVGLRRMGVQPGDDAVPLVEYIGEQPSLAFDGILGHDGHLPYYADTAADLEEGCEAVAADLQATVDALEGAGHSVERVVSGASATAPLMAKQDVITELDPGRYVFNDADLLDQAPHVEPADCGATFLTTVIAKPTPDRAIVDAGSKTISYIDGADPVPVGREDIAFVRKSSEHGFVDTSETTKSVGVGDRLEFVIPNGWAAFNLHDRITAVRDGVVEDVWHVEARGKVA